MQKTPSRNAERLAAQKRAEILTRVENFDRLPDSVFVRLPIVCILFDVSPPTVWRWAKAGRLPKPRKLGPGVSAWQVGELRRAQNREGA